MWGKKKNKSTGTGEKKGGGSLLTFVPHINFKKGNLNIGVRSGINLGPVLHTSSSSNTRLGASGYEHEEKNATSTLGIFSTQNKQREKRTLYRHSTSESHKTSLLGGVSSSSVSQSKSQTWTSTKESASREENISGLYHKKATQETTRGLTGYDNKWSTETNIAGLTSGASHHVGFGTNGVVSRDSVNMSAGNHNICNVVLPGIIHGGTNPSLHTTKPANAPNPGRQSASTSASKQPPSAQRGNGSSFAHHTDSPEVQQVGSNYVYMSSSPTQVPIVEREQGFFSCVGRTWPFSRGQGRAPSGTPRSSYR